MFRTRYPFQAQFDSMDCGAASLSMVMMYHGRYVDIEDIRETIGQKKAGVSISDIEQAADRYDLDAIAVSLELDQLIKEAPLPLVVHWKSSHFVVVNKITKKYIYVNDPASGALKLSYDKFLDGASNKNKIIASILFEPTNDFFPNSEKKEIKKNYRLFKNYFIPYKSYVALILTGLLFASLVNFAMPFLTKRIIDYGIVFKDTGFIFIILGTQLFFHICLAALKSSRNWIVLHVMGRVKYRMISDFLYRLFKQPISFFLTRHSTDLLQRVYDHKIIHEFLGVNLFSAVFGTINLVVFSIILLYFNTSIFLIYFLGLISYLAWTVIFLERRKENDSKTFENAIENSRILMELFDNVEDIYLNGSHKRRRKLWQNYQRNIFQTDIERVSIGERLRNGGDIINEGVYLIILAVGAIAVVKGELSLGSLLAIQYILSQVSRPIKELNLAILKYQEAALALKRIAQAHTLKDDEHKKRKTLLTEAPVIEIKALEFSYPGYQDAVLKNFDLKFEPNTVTAIVGHSGAGKTTLIKLLLKYYEVKKGSVEINGKKLNSLDAISWRKNVAVVMQDGGIFMDTLANNIAESIPDEPLDLERLTNAIEVARLEELVGNLPKGIHTLIGRNAHGISGGEKQRVLIARAVYKKASVIIFDEATSNLDSENERAIIDNLKIWFENKTVIIIAHRLSTVRNADNIVVIDSHGVAESGSHQVLLAKKGRYYELVQKQL